MSYHEISDGSWSEAELEVQRLRADNARLRKAVLNQCGDNLCHLTDQEITEVRVSGRIPPWSEFSQSCERFHRQIAEHCGELQGCMTIAQLEAEVERLKTPDPRLAELIAAAGDAEALLGYSGHLLLGGQVREMVKDRLRAALANYRASRALVEKERM